MADKEISALPAIIDLSNDALMVAKQDGAAQHFSLAQLRLLIGAGIASIEQTTASTASSGENVITVKLTDNAEMEFVVRNGARGDDGYTPVRGVDYYTQADEDAVISAAVDTVRDSRRTAKINFSDWDTGAFSETLEDGVVIAYTVEFDESGAPVSISDSDGHSMTISWPTSEESPEGGASSEGGGEDETIAEEVNA